MFQKTFHIEVNISLISVDTMENLLLGGWLGQKLNAFVLKSKVIVLEWSKLLLIEKASQISKIDV